MTKDEEIMAKVILKIGETLPEIKQGIYDKIINNSTMHIDANGDYFVITKKNLNKIFACDQVHTSV